jgi:hypothetical protein
MDVLELRLAAVRQLDQNLQQPVGSALEINARQNVVTRWLVIAEKAIGRTLSRACKPEPKPRFVE